MSCTNLRPLSSANDSGFGSQHAQVQWFFEQDHMWECFWTGLACKRVPSSEGLQEDRTSSELYSATSDLYSVSA